MTVETDIQQESPVAIVHLKSTPEVEVDKRPGRRRWIQPLTWSGSSEGVRSFCWLMVLPLASAVLLYACHFPIAIGWFAWFAFVPLLSLVRSTRRVGAIYWPAFLGGLACYVPMLQWFRVADDRMIFAWLFLAIYCALLWPVFLLLLRILDRRTRLPLVITAPVVWTALEYFRAHAGSGFSWYLLGYTQHNFLHIIQMADLTGVYGLSYLVMSVNALLAEVLLARGWWRLLMSAREGSATRFGLLARALPIVAVLLSALAYGEWRLRQGGGTPGPKVALLQGNLSQQIRNDASANGENATRFAANHYFYLASVAAYTYPELMVWPETSLPWVWYAVPQGKSTQQELEKVDDTTKEADMLSQWFHRTPLLIGVSTDVLQNNKIVHYNSAHLIGSDGVVSNRYDKIHRVPLGEYVPLRESLPILQKLAPYDFDYSIAEGQQFTRFATKTRAGRDFTFGTCICYEDTVPEVVRPYGGGDDLPPADFIVNISNDGWFDGTAEHDEHLAICRFRAVENRRSVTRAVNMGISAVIDGNGRVLRPEKIKSPAMQIRDNSMVKPQDFALWEIPDGAGELPISEWHLYKKQAGVLIANVPLDTRTSLYARIGEWVPVLCWMVMVVGLGLAIFRPRFQ